MSDPINLRPIRIAGQILMGAECERCPGAPALYPPTLLQPHLERHDVRAALGKMLPMIEPKVRYRGGRKVGAKGNRSMSSTGVERKTAIRNGR